MSTHRSDHWSQAHLIVNDKLTEMLNALRDLGYNPSLHISYDKDEHRLQVDEAILNQHLQIRNLYIEYTEACVERDIAVAEIKQLPKLDLGF